MSDYPNPAPGSLRIRRIGIRGARLQLEAAETTGGHATSASEG